MDDMSTEAMKLALEAIQDLRGYRPDIDKAIDAIRTAIQQAEAQQPATGEPVARSEREQLRHAQAAVVMPMIGPLLDAWENSDREVMSQEPELSKQLKNINSAMEDADTHPAPSAPDDVVEDGIRNAEDELNCAEEVLDAITCEFSDGEFPVTDFNCIGDYITAVVDVFKERLADRQPATTEPVQADSSEHLRVIASLGAALRRLSFAAQTTGGVDGPDAELQSAIGQAEQALSLGGIWQAMSATGEPVWCVATGERVNGEETYTHHDAYVPLADCFPLYTHPAPSAPKDDQIAALVNKVRDIARMFHDHQSLRERIAIELVPALKASQEVKSNAERWRYAIADGGNQSMNFIDIFGDWDGDGSFVEAFDKDRLADK